MGRALNTVRDEVHHFDVQLWLARSLLAPLPPFVGMRMRALGLRLAGFAIGRGTVLWGLPSLTGAGDTRARLRIGQDCWINVGCRFDLSDTLTIGDRVAMGHEVLIMTSSHEIGDADRRAGSLYTRPVVIGDGAWLGARCVILPGVTIGVGAVVASGALVHRDVPPNTLVGGVPARVLKTLPC